MNLSDGDVTVI